MSKEQKKEFLSACASGDIEAVLSFLKDRSFANHRKTLQQGVESALNANQIDLIHILLANQDIKPLRKSIFTEKVFSVACERGHLGLVKSLVNDKELALDLNKPRDFNNQAPLFKACSTGNIEVIKILIEDERVNINEPAHFGETPFFIACQKNRLDIVKILASLASVDMNQPNYAQETPFFTACLKGYLELAKFLASIEKIDVNKPSSKGVTPFWIACRNGSFEIVKHLAKEKRVDVNRAEDFGVTPFWMACSWGQNKTVKHLLLDERIDPNRQCIKGESPLWIACRGGYLQTVKILLASTQKIETTHSSKELKTTPAEQARRSKQKHIAELVEEYQRDPEKLRYRLRRELLWDGFFFFFFF